MKVFHAHFFLISRGYACTEAGQIARQDGALYSGVQYKLLDVEDYGYSSKDKPFPRGELLVTQHFYIMLTL
jgi:hypothetical protein